MQDRGEYVSKNSSMVFLQHLERYKFASKYTKEKVVLDVACGSGYGTEYLLRNGASKAVGVDISEKAIDEAKSKHSGEFHIMDATNLAFEDNHFDCVVSFETIEHLTEYRKFLEEIRRVTKNDGIVIMSTPNYIFEVVKYRYHVKNFRKEEFINLFKEYFKDVTFFGQSKWFLAFPGRGLLERIFGLTQDTRIYELSDMKINPQIMIAVGVNSK